MDKNRKKVRPAKVIGVVIVLIAVFAGIGIRQLWLEGVFSRPHGVTETQSVESEAMAVGDTAPERGDPAERFLEILAQGTDSPEAGVASLEAIAGTGNVRLTLIVLITLCISVFGLFVAVGINYRVSKVAKTASAAMKAAFTEEQKHRMLYVADKVDTLSSRLGEIEKRTDAILERLAGHDKNLDVVSQDIQENAAAVTEVRDDLARFGHFQSNVEEIHRRLADAFSLAQDTESEESALPDEQDSEEPEEDLVDSGEDTHNNWTDRYGYPMAG